MNATERAYQGLVSAVASRGAADDWYRLGQLLHEMRRWGSAAGCFARSLELGCGSVERGRVLANWGWNLHLGGREEDALGVLSEAVELSPRDGSAWARLGVVAGVLGDGDASVLHSRRAVELDPSPIHRFALGFALMMGGEWGEGLREYGHRFAYRIPEFLTRPYRLWGGEGVGHLYLEGEQGHGDTLMMLRYVGWAAELAGRVTLYVQGSIYPLMERCGLPGNVRVMPLPQPLPGNVDAWAPLFSLPAALGVTGPEWGGVYVRARPVVRRTGEFHVGIVWAGSRDHEQSHHRDVPLAYFMRLSEIPGVRLHSLQVGEAGGQMGDLAAFGLIRDRAPEITNFGDTARVIEGLDLVISVDTAVAHLAGAMGVPTWLLLNTRGQDFRWGRDSETTGWYPSMRLFRRGLKEDWAAVMERVAAALPALVGEVAVPVAVEPSEPIPQPISIYDPIWDKGAMPKPDGMGIDLTAGR
jgi:hypothetical protein